MKRIIKSSLAGVAVGFLIALLFSWVNSGGKFLASKPQFNARFSSNLTAVTVSAGIWALMGAIFGASYLIFEQEKWSITRQTVIHFLVTIVFFLPLAIFAGWFPFTAGGIISAVVEFVIIYSLIWWWQMERAKKKIKMLNDAISAS
ncbi:DUF3021 domain-containing protein [Xylocopilactobacillus apicola]|uniref:DUF3021 domain-containing protein n=1 Tax=Xylocopilactobacillus apicola TaxID=2932184 RepID=A0AAU9DAG1_9LACO|nr:DUF3021 domain-containing protein [Xylocopilactobacillus apicola]BDR57827.1 DUF3021 domain-containing protein [Xylocopilactobacillus apicola]